MGALRLDNTKVLFALDGDGNPCEAFQYVTKDSNHLVEEFMLLANKSVRGVLTNSRCIVAVPSACVSAASPKLFTNLSPSLTLTLTLILALALTLNAAGGEVI
eukprot:1643424-Pyramimonas_sp.AAC.1